MKAHGLDILLIEDNLADAELFREMVSGRDGTCELRIADRLGAGLQMLSGKKADVVFLDLGLPDSSGIETLTAFQDRHPDLPVIVLTGLSDQELAARAIALGAQDYLVKGRFESEALYRSVLYSMERKRNEVAIRERKELSDAVNRLDNLIHSTLDLDAVLSEVVATAAQAIGADAAVVGLLRDDVVIIKAAHNLPPELAGRFVPAQEMKAVLYAASARDVVTFEDALRDERLNRRMVEELGARSIMIAPLILKGDVLGAMGFYALSAARSFTDAQLDFARKVSFSISTALENARLYEALRNSEQLSRDRLSQLEAVYTGAPVGLCFLDTDLRYININQRLAEVNGMPVEDHIGKTVRDVAPEMADAVEPMLRQAVETGSAVENVELRGFTKTADGEDRFWLSSYYPVKDPSGRTIGVNVVVQDISSRKKMEEEIRHLANHDALTGLPNRRLFLELIALEMAQARRHGTKMAVFFLDLDRFKNINDTLGHEAGDELLKEVAAGLRGTVRSSDTVARIGGDEFNLIIADINHADDVLDIAKKVMEYFARTFLIAGQELRITASVGISVFPDDGREIDALLRYADIAMYHAKEQGRSKYQFYNPDINTRSIERMHLENWLSQSLAREELSIHYQPLVSIRSRKIVCAEALVRWHHPELGLIDPVRFIPLAEETGFIAAIDVWVLRTVCGQVKRWLDAGVPAMCVTVNLSARLFEDPELVGTVERILRETGMPPGHLDIEITETMAMSNVERTAVRLRQLTEMGIHISIDDFGTGYSSLSYLKRLPINRLKIDKSFVQDISTDPDDRTIISAVTAMAHNMKMKVIAEGVETEEQLSFLRRTGCDEMQGFLFSKPLPATEFEELVLAET